MDPDSSILKQLVILVILIAVSAFFTVSEITTVSLNDAKLRKMADEGHKKARLLLRMVGKPSKFFATIQVGVTLSGFFAAAVAAYSFTNRLSELLAGYGVAGGWVRSACLVAITLALAFFAIVFGQLVPKHMAMRHHEAIAMAVARPLLILSKLEAPYVALLSSTSNGLLRMLGINPERIPESVTEEEILMMVDVGNESGNIEESERVMINNIFEFDDRTAEEMMTHRTEIGALELTAPLETIIHMAVETGYSRIPVYEGDLDSIVGILYVKDLLGRVLQNPGEPFSLKDVMREPFYVLESTTCEALMTEFKQKKLHMAVVVDEYGGTSGLVTMEDLLESIVGNIQDEYDDEEEEISAVGENSYLVDGLADLEKAVKFLGLSIPEDDEEEFETLGGYIVHKLGYIPGESDKPEIRLGDIHFTVLEMEDRHISKLRAERILPGVG